MIRRIILVLLLVAVLLALGVPVVGAVELPDKWSSLLDAHDRMHAAGQEDLSQVIHDQMGRLECPPLGHTHE